MSDLRLNLDTTNFKELVEIGRSMIPTVAPGWSDHNVHDPGIMLMELVAWIADAQIYALSRSSRREREAYGHVLGLTLTSARPASGLIWPLAADAPPGSLPSWAAGTIVDAGKKVIGNRPQAPPFFTSHRIELTRAQITRVATQYADGSARDWTRANSQQGATFLPFGEAPAKGDTLVLTVTGTLIGDPPPGSPPSEPGPIAIGFDLVTDSPSTPDGDPDGDAADACACGPVHFSVSLMEGTVPWDVSVEADTTGGLAHSGVLLLKVDKDLLDHQGTFTLSIRSETGEFLLPPRVQRIALNVLPVHQLEHVTDEEVSSFGTGLPDQSYPLARTGLVHPLTTDNFKAFVAGDGTSLDEWTRTDDLGSAEPDAAVYAVDIDRGVVRFGNGINGRMPRGDAALRVEYFVTAGAPGNLPPGMQWTVQGVPAPFGINSEVMSGGRVPRDLAQLRAEARRRVRQSRPIVTSADLQNAALAFADLDVRRARELLPGTGERRLRGARVLVAVGPHDASGTSDAFEESDLWLGEIRRRLVERLPLGQSLEVIGPRLVTVRVLAHVVAAPRQNPDDVRTTIEKMLRDKLAITSTDRSPVWPFGRDMTALIVKGWIRKVKGVASVTDVTLLTDAGREGTAIVELGPISLPRLHIESGDIDVERSPAGGRA